MPMCHCPSSLTSQCVSVVSHQTRSALVRIDSKWKHFKPVDPKPRSPRVSPINPRTAGSIIPPAPSSPPQPTPQDNVTLQQNELRDWLSQMPTPLLQDVVQKVVGLIEMDINEDKDRKIILTLINIESTNPSHFSFGVYSLLVCLASTRIGRLPFSTKLWFCIWEFEQLTTSNHLRHCLNESIPKMTHLTAVNFAYIATDQIMYLLCKYCPKLEEICLDHSSVSDRSLRFLCGADLNSLKPPSPRHRSLGGLLPPSSNKSSSPTSHIMPFSISQWVGINHLTQPQSTVSPHYHRLADGLTSSSLIAKFEEACGSSAFNGGAPQSCTNLKCLSLQGCSSITDAAVWNLLVLKPSIQVIRYHQAYSVAEILSRQCMSYSGKHGGESTRLLHGDCSAAATTSGSGRSSPSDIVEGQIVGPSSPSSSTSSSSVFGGSSNQHLQNQPQLKLSLKVFDHPFPYGLNLKLDVVKQISKICPDITTMNLVSMDSYVPDYGHFSKLVKVALELEDCFGKGLMEFLKTMGRQLNELTLSCSSDSDSTNIEGGGTQYQLFNVGLRLSRLFCPNVTHLNISGCGLVSNQLLELLEEEEEIADRAAKRPKMAFNQGQAPQTCLKSLIMLTYYEDTDQVQTCEEKLLLETIQNSPDLECISLEGNFSSFLNDRFLEKILRKNSLPKLRIFDVRGRPSSQFVPLTIQSANMLVKNLPSIQVLRMYSWNITDAQYEQLQSLVKSKGWNLRITRKAQIP